MLSAAPPPIAPAFCTRSPRRRGEPRLQSGPWEASSRTGVVYDGYTPPQCDICRSMRIAGDNVQADVCAVAAHKCKTQVNLLAESARVAVSTSPFLPKPKKDRFCPSWVSAEGIYTCNGHAIQTSCSCIRATTSRRADELAPTRLASPVDGAQQGARCTVSMITSPTKVPSPVWRKHETSPKVRRQPESTSGRAQASRTSVRDGGSKLSRHMHARDPYAHTLTHCPWPFRCHRVLLFSSEP